VPNAAKDNVVYRHRLLVRVTHWVNALALILLLMSGLNIFNAHPALYWGHSSHFTTPLAAFEVPWIFTLPGFRALAIARHWHFFFAWVLVLNAAVYVASGFATRHVQRDLWAPVRDLKTLPHEILDHLRLRFPTGEAARAYNVLQKLSYLGVIFILGPLIVLTGLSMSPGVNGGALGFLPDLFGGRQSARTVHFACAALFALFIVVHLVMVVLSGPLNNIRSMITGRYVLPGERR
jgi:thiosulfate reductase cytochrome b subunit